MRLSMRGLGLAFLLGFVGTALAVHGESVISTRLVHAAMTDLAPIGAMIVLPMAAIGLGQLIRLGIGQARRTLGAAR